MTARDYSIAGLRLRLADERFAFGGMEPFRIPALAKGAPDLEIRFGTLPETLDLRRRTIDTFDFPDADADCRLERCTPTEYLFTMTPRSGRRPVQFRSDLRTGVCLSDFRHDDLPALFRFGLWMALNLQAVGQGVAALHSSVIIHRGEGVLFLGESGTGKSTHTRLWRQHIPGCELLNDDSPFVRTATTTATATDTTATAASTDGRPCVCGSPWSGKTPCYRPLEIPIRAIVRLSQGPENRIERLPLLRAYGALQPSFPPSLAYDETLADGINTILSRLLRCVPVYHLSCRPDADAAQLACNTLYAPQ